jgi:hypothetical protein
VRNNRFWDNRRRGVMLFSAPDATICGPGIGTPVTGCDPSKVSTSYRNSFYGNTMGVAPDGATMLNGTDFWWDSYPGNTGNCWWGNHAAQGHSVTTSPSPLPDCAAGANPDSSMGTGDPQNEGELVACLAEIESSDDGNPSPSSSTCSWAQTPGKPQSRAAAMTRAFDAFCSMVGAIATCAPFAQQLAAHGVQLHEPATASGSAWLQPAATGSRPLGLYTCRDWRRGSAGMRAGVLQRLHHWVGGPVESTTLMGFGTVLPDAWATQLFDSRCSRPFARSFKLYRLYGPAAAFAGVAP